MNNSFELLVSNRNLLKGVFMAGFDTPSAVQNQSIPKIINKKNLIIQSKSGSGKTLSFLIGVLNNINPSKQHTQCLILSPTRELSEQTCKIAQEIAEFLNITIGLDENVQVLCSTPKRMVQIIKNIKINKLEMIVIDECDSFKEQILNVFKYLPENIQKIFVSATMKSDLREIMIGCEKVYIKNVDKIKHSYLICKNEEDKMEKICEIYDSMSIIQSIVFVNKREQADKIVRILKRKNFSVDGFHGKMELNDREKIFKKFVNGETRVLVSTDVLGRGVDVSKINLVINFSLPIDKENYLHRVGRGGRYGRKSIAVTFVLKNEVSKIETICKLFKVKIEEMKI